MRFTCYFYPHHLEVIVYSSVSKTSIPVSFKSEPHYKWIIKYSSDQLTVCEELEMLYTTFATIGTIQNVEQ
jgi:hypothetical protein